VANAKRKVERFSWRVLGRRARGAGKVKRSESGQKRQGDLRKLEILAIWGGEAPKNHYHHETPKDLGEKQNQWKKQEKWGGVKKKLWEPKIRDTRALKYGVFSTGS